MSSSFLFFVLFLITPTLFALDKDVVPDKVEVDKDLKTGWTHSLDASANISLNSSKDVVGQTSGDSYTYGGGLDAKSYFKNEISEWRNDLSLKAKTSKTPTVNKYIKADDEFKIQTLYLRRLKNYPKMGPYAKASADSNLFRGEDFRAITSTYQVVDKNGSSIGSPILATSFKLADPFGITTLKQSVGLFAQPLKSDNHKLELRLGLGAIQVYSDKQYSIKKVDGSTIQLIEILPLDEQGAELGLNFDGVLDEKTSYGLSAEVLYPFSPDKSNLQNKAEIEFVNVDFKFNISSKIYEWASLKYDYTAAKHIQSVDAWQITHGLVLNISYNLL